VNHTQSAQDLFFRTNFETAASRICLFLSLLFFSATPSLAETRTGMLRPISTAEFMSFSENSQVIYVAGILEGMAAMGYKNTAEYRNWTDCVRSKTLGETTREVVALIKQDPNYKASIATALSRSLGKRCKR
jgi:hypothetical protein